MFRMMKESPEVEPLGKKQREVLRLKREMRILAFPQEKGEERVLEILAGARIRPEGVEAVM